MERLAKPSRPFMHDNDHRGFFNVQHRLLESHTLVRGGDTSTEQSSQRQRRSYVITLDLKPRVGSESLPGANCVLSHPLLRVLSTPNDINTINNSIIITHHHHCHYQHHYHYHHHHHKQIVYYPAPLLRMLSTPNIKRRGGRCSQRNQPINLPEKIKKSGNFHCL